MTRCGPRILIRGGGLAGVTAAKLLRDRGASVRIAAPRRRAGRIVTVPIDTLVLAASLFEIDIATLQIGPMVEGRQVAWSVGELTVVPQVAIACDAAELATTLANQLGNVARGMGEADDNDADWIVEASGRAADGSACGGARVGQFARIANVGFEAMTSITATSRGWVFTAPHPEGGLSVLMVAPSAADTALTADDVAERLALADRRVSAADIIAIDRPVPVAPRLSECLIVENRIRVGDAALTIDPLRGDGVGFALRGALLAQAVLTAIDGGQERAPICGHYHKRLRAIFVSHLKGCSAYYRAARHPTVWNSNVAAMEDLIARLDVREDAFQFRLDGLDLVRMQASDECSFGEFDSPAK